MQTKIALWFLLVALSCVLPASVFGQAPKVYFHMGNSQSAPAPWNNAIGSPYAGGVFADLKDDSGNNTGMKVELLTNWGGSYPSGVTTGNNSGIVPDVVLSEYYWFGLGISATEMHVRISGMTPGSNHNFKFVGSSAYRDANVSNNGNTIYTINGVSASLYVDNNTSQAAAINNVVPNAQGEVEVVITMASNAQAGYLNAIIIELPADALYTPAGLHATPQSGTLKVQWTDNNTTETGYDIYRANVISGESFQLVGSAAANATSYVDNGVLEGYTYQYKIRAKNATKTSGFSSVYTATMPVSHGSTVSGGNRVYFDFGASNTGPSPWNNAGRDPAAGVVFNNTLDQNGANTGVIIELLTNWGGSYTDGATTGNNSGIVPDAILKDYYWFGIFGAPNAVVFKVRGLTPGSAYNFQFVGSSVFRQAGITDNGHTVYKIGTDSVSLNVEGNTANAAQFSSIKANALGEVIVTIRKGPDASVGYLNAMMIDLPSAIPPMPTNLLTTVASSTAIKLTWSDVSSHEDGFEIQRSTSMGSGFVTITTTGPNVVTYTDQGLTTGTAYYYRIRSVNASGNSNYTTTVTGVPLGLPASPTGLSAAVALNRITLNWSDASNNESGFKIERSLTPGADYLEIATSAANAVSYSDANVAANTAYFYRIRAFNAAGNSAYTSEISATTPIALPESPTDFAVVVASPTSITITWKDNSNNETEFELERSLTPQTGFALVSTVPANSTTFTDTTLTSGSTYYYRMRAVNSSGASGYTAELSVRLPVANANGNCGNIYCDPAGGVGIGTTKVPTGYRVAVSGKIMAEGVKVLLQSDWPDYVFGPGYDLPELPEVKKYIDANGHLPGVPSATEVDSKGVEVGEINVILLKKIEELSLYLIQMEERMKALEAENAKLKVKKK